MNIMDIFGGKNVFIRTVTYHYTGRLVGQTSDGLLVLEDAAWIADSGRFGKVMISGHLDEVEAYPDGWVVVGAIVDVTEWGHELPRVSK